MYVSLIIRRESFIGSRFHCKDMQKKPSIYSILSFYAGGVHCAEDIQTVTETSTVIKPPCMFIALCFS